MNVCENIWIVITSEDPEVVIKGKDHDDLKVFIRTVAPGVGNMNNGIRVISVGKDPKVMNRSMHPGMISSKHMMVVITGEDTRVVNIVEDLSMASTSMDFRFFNSV